MSDYSNQCLNNMAGKAWEDIVIANGGICVNNGWHLEVTGSGTVMVLSYIDCDGTDSTHRIIL